jgi:hypothetical protein
MQRSSVLLGLVLLAATGPAFAVGSLADVSIVDRASGKTLPVHQADGGWYVAGRTGKEYEVRIRNNTGGDLLAVVSVDGVNVVTGETAATSQGGYVVGAGQLLRIEGWRKNLLRVAAFYFTEHGDAYATRTGRPDDVGVIGVAVFRRKLAPPVELEEPSVRRQAPLEDRSRQGSQFEGQSRGDAAKEGKARREAPSAATGDAESAARDSAPRAAAPASPEKSIGTGHGRQQTSHARYVSFERELDTPNELVTIRYDTFANLVAQGVIRRELREPNPFPAHFVPDPPRRW